VWRVHRNPARISFGSADSGGAIRRYDRDDAPDNPLPAFEADNWQDYVPIRLSKTVCVEEKLPPGAAGVLINQNHTDKDIYLPINAEEKRMFEAIDGILSIAENSQELSEDQKSARSAFRRFWWFDQVVFDTSKSRQ